MTSILVLLLLAASSVAEEAAPGLAGIYFRSEHFQRPAPGLDVLHGVDHDWGRRRGGGWSARWAGRIEGPTTGEVTFTAEATDGLRLQIGDDLVVVIDGLSIGGPRTGRVTMTRGQRIPILLAFDTTGGRARLRLQWEWEGQPRTIVPVAALSHDPSALPEDLGHEGPGKIYAAPPLEAGQIDLSPAVIVASSSRTTHARAADMLHDEIAKRTRIRLPVRDSMPPSDTPAIVLGAEATDPLFEAQPPSGLAVPARADGYALWVDTWSRPAPTIRLVGHDDRGALFAAGRLLRSVSMRRDVVGVDPDLRVSSAPRYSLRGHQLGYRPKTNSYDAWTVAMWEQYYRDLAVFGTNAVELIPPRSDDDADSPHFPLPQMEMMVEMSRLADEHGLEVWIWYPPIELDGDIAPDVATVEAALQDRHEVFRRLPRVDAVFVPSGDPGDVDPRILLPFVERQKEVLIRSHPEATIWVSPQNYGDDDDWLVLFLELLQTDQPPWLDGVVFGPAVETTLSELRRQIPARYPLRRYPDITHSMSCQYEVPGWDEAYRRTLGREGINPRPRAYAEIFRAGEPHSFGFVSYSEGNNDDVNKFVWSALGWDPDRDVEDILKEYSRYFIGERLEERFAEGLLALERNWDGPLLENDGVLGTLDLFREMERDATPAELLNWRFQQGLYRAYYDALVRVRLVHEQALQRQALAVLDTAPRLGSIEAMGRAQALLAKAETEHPAPELRARVFELAEALFQSSRMQLSVPRYQAISVGRGANLDSIDEPLNDRRALETGFGRIRQVPSEDERLRALVELVQGL